MIRAFQKRILGMTTDARFAEIVTGSAWALAGRVGATVIAMLTSIIVARVYGAEVMGVVAVVNSVLLLATIFSVLGTSTSIMRLIPEHMVKFSAGSAYRVYRKTQYIVIVVGALIGAILFVGARWVAEAIFSKPHLAPFLALAGVFVIFKSLVQLNTQAVRGLKLRRTFALMQILPHAFNLLLVVSLPFFLSGRDIPIYAVLGSVALTGVTGWLLMEQGFRKQITADDHVEAMPARDILSISAPMFMTATIDFAGAQTGVIMLGIFSSEAQLGIYSVAVKLATLTGFILAAINSTAAPKFAELFHANKVDELFYVAKRSARLVFWTTTPILLGLVIFGKPVLRLLFGPEFTDAYRPLLFLAAGQFVNSISGCTGLFMNMTGRQKEFRNIVMLQACLNVTLTIILIPRYGITGAAIAFMVSECFWNFATLLYIKRQHGQATGYFPMFSRVQSMIGGGG